MEYFSYVNTDWKNTVGDHEPEEFLKVIQGKFLKQVIRKTISGENILNVVLTNNDNVL